MNAVIGHWSALEYWRFLRSHGKAATEIYLELPECFPREGLDFHGGKLEVARFLTEHRMTAPLHLLVSGKAQWRSRPETKCHLETALVGKRLFRAMEDGVYLSSPELLYLQMSSDLDVIDLVRLGYELCSTFALNTNDDRIESVALTTVASLRSAVTAGYDVGNKRKALEALKHLHGVPDSPPEMELAMKMTLPFRFGGLRVEDAESNPEIKLSEKAKLITGTDHCRGDLYCADIAYDIEYDSSEWHSTVEQRQHDEKRKLALESDGVIVRSIGRSELSSYTDLHGFAREISRLRKRRFRIHRKDFSDRRAQLWERIDGGPMLTADCLKRKK